MLTRSAAELLVPEPLPDDWREALRLIARRAYAAYVEHPWMMQAFGTGTRVGPNMLRRAEQSAAAVASLDLDAADAWTALSIVHEWTIGHALHVVTLREDAELEGQLRAADPATSRACPRSSAAARGESRDTTSTSRSRRCWTGSSGGCGRGAPSGGSSAGVWSIRPAAAAGGRVRGTAWR